MGERGAAAADSRIARPPGLSVARQIRDRTNVETEEAPAVVAYRVSWPDQVILRCTLATLAETMKEAKIHLTALILVGPMLDPDRAKNSHLYDREFSHRYRRGQNSASR